jgi:hypothetical protein
VKLLLDENLPHDLRHHLVGHEVFTVTYMGWSGTKNGALLLLAADAGFDLQGSVMTVGRRRANLNPRLLRDVSRGRLLVIILRPSLGVVPVVDRFEDRQHFLQELLIDRFGSPLCPEFYVFGIG